MSDHEGIISQEETDALAAAMKSVNETGELDMIKDNGMKKIKKEELENLVAGERYDIIPGTTTTICTIFLTCGFSVSGESACLNPKDFDLEIGKEKAYDDAFNRLWVLEGYHRTRIHYDGYQTSQDNPIEALGPETVHGVDRVFVNRLICAVNNQLLDRSFAEMWSEDSKIIYVLRFIMEPSLNGLKGDVLEEERELIVRAYKEAGWADCTMAMEGDGSSPVLKVRLES